MVKVVVSSMAERGTNVWSASILQVIISITELVCANVFGVFVGYQYIRPSSTMRSALDCPQKRQSILKKLLKCPTGLQSSGLTVVSSLSSFANQACILTSNACLVDSTDHAIRASLFANATTTTLYGFRDSSSNIQLPKVATAFSGLTRTALAP